MGVLDSSVITLALDALLVGAGVLSAAVAWRGLRARGSVGILTASVALAFLGFVHIIETSMWIGLGFIGQEAIEIVHRLLVLGAFGWLLYGLARAGRELDDEWQKVIQGNAALVEAKEELRGSNEELKERNRRLLEAYDEAFAEQQPIRVLIASPSSGIRRVLTSLLSATRDMSLVGDAASDEETIMATEALAPDVALVDDTMANPHLIATLTEAAPRTSVLILATYPAGELDLLAAGAADYILKDAGRDRLAEAIRGTTEKRSALHVIVGEP